MTILSFVEAEAPPELPSVTMLLVEAGRVVSALDVLSERIEDGGVSYEACDLSTVVTDEPLRGSGYGRRLVIAARETTAASVAEPGISTCDPPLQAYCESCGWEVLPGMVLIGGAPEVPLPSDRLGKVTLAAFFSERAQRRAGFFVGARVKLYPGEIDRLW